MLGLDVSSDGSSGQAGTSWDYLNLSGVADFSGASAANPVTIILTSLSNSTTDGRPSDLRVVIVNSALMNADGSGPVRNLDVGIDQRGLALLVALILATPVSRRRWGWAIFWGVISFHGAMLSLLNFLIWRESAEIGLVTLTPFWKAAADTLRGIVIEQIDLGLPIVTWILVTFRRGDRIAPLGRDGVDDDRAADVPVA